jgi:hypothetical protein
MDGSRIVSVRLHAITSPRAPSPSSREGLPLPHRRSGAEMSVAAGAAARRRRHVVFARGRDHFNALAGGILRRNLFVLDLPWAGWRLLARLRSRPSAAPWDSSSSLCSGSICRSSTGSCEPSTRSFGYRPALRRRRLTDAASAAVDGAFRTHRRVFRSDLLPSLTGCETVIPGTA